MIVLEDLAGQRESEGRLRLKEEGWREEEERRRSCRSSEGNTILEVAAVSAVDIVVVAVVRVVEESFS